MNRGWVFVCLFFLNGWFRESRRRSRSAEASDSQTADALDGILESEPTPRL